MSKAIAGTAPDIAAPAIAPVEGATIPIRVEYGPAAHAEYTTTQFDSTVDIHINVDIRGVWEPKNDGHHWMQLTVWLDGNPKPHYFSGEVPTIEGQATMVMLPPERQIRLTVPPGKQHVIAVRHENAGTRALELNVTGSVRKK